MKSAVIYSAVFAVMASCVPVAKYQSAQSDINQLQGSNAIIKALSDSLKENYMILKSDYNHLSYDLEETQKYASFSDRELIRELNKEKVSGKKYADMFSQLQVQANNNYQRSVQRTKIFSQEASCLLNQYSHQNFILVSKNILTLDIEGLMLNAKDQQPALKNSLKELMYSFRNREDCTVSVTLYQSAANTSWNKMAVQQELLGFLATEAGVNTAKIQGLTRLITKEKSQEFGISTDSRLLLEFEFKA